MRHNKTYKRLSDGALERIMLDVLNGMQTFSSALVSRPQTRVRDRPGAPESHPLSRFTSLSSADLFGSDADPKKSN